MSSAHWRQVGGDIDPATYGGLIARYDGDAIEMLGIEPIRYLCGDSAALEEGYPFWASQAYYDPGDLALVRLDVARSLEYAGVETLPVGRDDIAMCVAICLYNYGYKKEPADDPGGFAKDILGDRRVRWWGCTSLRGWRHLESEDVEFRALVRENKRKTPS